MKIGIGINEWARALPAALEQACIDLGVDFQRIDFLDLSKVEVTHLAPALLYLKNDARKLYQDLEKSGIKTLNPVSAIDIADDKAATYKALQEMHVESQIIELSLENLQSSFLGVPTVYKRTHGGQGRWVRLANSLDEIPAIYNDFITEGPGEILVQRFIAEAHGETNRVIVTGSKVLATALRKGQMDFRSNIALGGDQVNIEITEFESELAIKSCALIGIGHAGVDLIRTYNGTQVLEVNACPDFTSMKNLVEIDIAQEVIKTLLLK